MVEPAQDSPSPAYSNMTTADVGGATLCPLTLAGLLSSEQLCRSSNFNLKSTLSAAVCKGAVPGAAAAPQLYIEWPVTTIMALPLQLFSSHIRRCAAAGRGALPGAAAAAGPSQGGWLPQKAGCPGAEACGEHRHSHVAPQVSALVCSRHRGLAGWYVTDHVNITSKYAICQAGLMH